jgi:excisionase family DNA binding protein
MKSTYSTAELANLLSVNESTIKRWSDAGDLACVKTRGGHRRFAVATVMEFIHSNKLSVRTLAMNALTNEDLQAHVLAGNIHKLVPTLKKEMMAGSVQGILRILRIAFVARPKLLELFSELVFPPLIEIGEEWQKKVMSVDQEHLASNALKEALVYFQSELHRKEQNGLKALCACPEGEWHDIAIRCVGYYLETEGWNVLFLGQSSPISSLVGAVKTHKPNLVALSTILSHRERSFVNAINKDIYPAVHRVKAHLALGGPGIKARLEGKVKAEHLCDLINECEVLSNPTMYTSHQ